MAEPSPSQNPNPDKDSPNPKAEGYAKSHERYLRENKPEMLRQMEQDGSLKEYLTGIGEQAAEMHDFLMSQRMKDPSFPTEYLARVEALAAADHQMDELVAEDLILQPR